MGNGRQRVVSRAARAYRTWGATSAPARRQVSRGVQSAAESSLTQRYSQPVSGAVRTGLSRDISAGSGLSVRTETGGSEVFRGPVQTGFGRFSTGSDRFRLGFCVSDLSTVSVCGDSEQKVTVQFIYRFKLSFWCSDCSCGYLGCLLEFILAERCLKLVQVL